MSASSEKLKPLLRPIKFQVEALPTLFDEMMPLLKEHYNEIAHYPDIALEPDFEMYRKAHDAGFARAYTARTAAGSLIGYSIFFVRPNMHYKTSIQANQDILFIRKANRGLGGKFIAWCDVQLAKEGIQAVYHHVKSKHNFGPLLERLGYELVDLIYARRLDKWQ